MARSIVIYNASFDNQTCFGYSTFKFVWSPPTIHCHVLLTASYYFQLTHINTHVCLFSVKFLEVIKPFCAVLPEIQKPERKVCITLILLTHLSCIAVSISYKTQCDCPTDPVQREGIMDCHHPFHLPGLLPGKCHDKLIEL